MGNLDDSVAASAIDAQRNARRLSVRLKREHPWGRAVGCALFLGLLLMSFAGGFLALARRMPPEGDNQWVPYVVLGVFGFVGVLLFLSGVHQWFASRIRETILEIDQDPIPVGATVAMCVRQEGPVSLSSLRANLRCVERKHEWNTRSDSDGNPETYKTTNEKELFKLNILDEQPESIPAEEFWETSLTFQIPADARPSSTSADLEVVWMIEVWGKVRRWPDFMHPYLLNVVDPAAPRVNDDDSQGDDDETDDDEQ